MRYLLFTLVVIVSVASAQTVKVIKIDRLTSIQDGTFYYPCFNPNGSNILFSGPGYTGLLYYDINKKQIIRMNAYPGAGYEPVFSADGNKVFFQINSYERGRKFTSIGEYDFNSNAQQIIYERSRDISLLALNQDGDLVIRHKNRIETIQAGSWLKNNSTRLSKPIIYTEGEALFLEQADNKKELTPLGTGNYIWPSLSPDMNRILFTRAGMGTYISDLDGNIETELGYANAPQWSPDGNWILYMNDTDDGHRYISSDIYIVTAAGSPRFKLTDSDQIYMYPQWSPDMQRIVFHSEEGIIYLLELQFN